MRLLRVSLWLFALLALTGFGLMCYYVPSTEPIAAAGTASQAISFGGVLRGIHFWASTALGPLLLAVLTSLVRRSAALSHRRAFIAALLGLLLLSFALWFTGIVLPWDALSYWLKELAHERGIHLSILQIYWMHVAILPPVFAACAFFTSRRFGSAGKDIAC